MALGLVSCVLDLVSFRLRLLGEVLQAVVRALMTTFTAAIDISKVDFRARPFFICAHSGFDRTTCEDVE
jgi:hypothetical protein